MQEAQSKAEQEVKALSAKLAHKEEEMKRVEAARTNADQEIEHERVAEITEDQVGCLSLAYDCIFTKSIDSLTYSQTKLNEEGTSVTELNVEIERLQQEQQVEDQAVQQRQQNQVDEELSSAVEGTALKVACPDSIVTQGAWQSHATNNTGVAQGYRCIVALCVVPCRMRCGVVHKDA